MIILPATRPFLIPIGTSSWRMSGNTLLTWAGSRSWPLCVRNIPCSNQHQLIPMKLKTKLSDVQLRSLEAGDLVIVSALITPAPSMLSEPYLAGRDPRQWFSGSGLMSCSHKCQFGCAQDQFEVGSITVQVVEVWAALLDKSRNVHWKENPWHFFAKIRKV